MTNLRFTKPGYIWPEPEVLYRMLRADTYKVYRNANAPTALVAALFHGGFVKRAPPPEPWHYIVVMTAEDLTWLGLHTPVRIETDWSCISDQLPAQHHRGHSE